MEYIELVWNVSIIIRELIMSFTPSIWDLGIWAVISAALILMTSEVILPYYGRTNIILKSRNMRYIGIALTIIFFIIAILRVIVVIQS